MLHSKSYPPLANNWCPVTEYGMPAALTICDKTYVNSRRGWCLLCNYGFVGQQVQQFIQIKQTCIETVRKHSPAVARTQVFVVRLTGLMNTTKRDPMKKTYNMRNNLNSPPQTSLPGWCWNVEQEPSRKLNKDILNTQKDKRKHNSNTCFLTCLVSSKQCAMLPVQRKASAIS